MTTSERYAELFPIAQDIALNLTAITKREWIAQSQHPVEFYNYIKITSGTAEISISAETVKGSHVRINVHGNTPRGEDRQYIRAYEQRIIDGKPYGWTEFKFDGISVASNRGAQTIAKEIARRFLPDYLKAVDLTLAKIQADKDYADSRRANLEACAATLGEVLRANYRNIRGCDPVLEPVTEFSSKIGKVIRVECRASANDVDLKIDNLSVEQAKQILALVKNLALPRNLA